MRHRFTLVLNVGRSGSSFLRDYLRANVSNPEFVYHESISFDTTHVRSYFRCYEHNRIMDFYRDVRVARQIEKWKQNLLHGPVVECGHTVSLLAPLLVEELGDSVRMIVLHRHPVKVAASFSVLGFYQPLVYHEIAPSPFDPHIRYRQYTGRWAHMTPFEKNLYRWLEYMAYFDEFLDQNANVPRLYVGADQLFECCQTRDALVEFMGFRKNSTEIILRESGRNSLMKMHLETTPILGGEWKRYSNHPEVIEFANDIGYQFDDEELEKSMQRYLLPGDIVSRLRYMTGYHVWKRRLKRMLHESLES